MNSCVTRSKLPYGRLLVFAWPARLLERERQVFYRLANFGARCTNCGWPPRALTTASTSATGLGTSCRAAGIRGWALPGEVLAQRQRARGDAGLHGGSAELAAEAKRDAPPHGHGLAPVRDPATGARRSAVVTRRPYGAGLTTQTSISSSRGLRSGRILVRLRHVLHEQPHCAFRVFGAAVVEHSISARNGARFGSLLTASCTTALSRRRWCAA